MHLLRDEYRIKRVTKVRADSIEELAAKLEGVSARPALATIRAYNAAVDKSASFDPNVKDGRRTRGLKIDKTNWANTIDEPPFEANGVTCGIPLLRRAALDPTRACRRESAWMGGRVRAGELRGVGFSFQLSRRDRTQGVPLRTNCGGSAARPPRTAA